MQHALTGQENYRLELAEAAFLHAPETTINCECGCKVPLEQVVTIEEMPCCVACAVCFQCGATATCTNNETGEWSCARHEMQERKADADDETAGWEGGFAPNH